MQTSLARTRGGTMVHRADCRYAQPRPYTIDRPHQSVYPWDWADSKSESLIAWVIVNHRYRTCRFCTPIDPKLLEGWRVTGYMAQDAS